MIRGVCLSLSHTLSLSLDQLFFVCFMLKFFSDDFLHKFSQLFICLYIHTHRLKRTTKASECGGKLSAQFDKKSELF